MAVEKGIVTYYDGTYGEIKKENDKYIFLQRDMESNINIGSLVSFKGEEVQGIKRAYFVNSLEKINFSGDFDEKQKQLK